MKSSRLTSGALGQPGQWNALHDDAQGSATLLAHNLLGVYFFTNPSNGQTITFTVNGTAIVLTGRTGTISVAGDFKIQGTVAATIAVIQNLLQNPWTTNATQIALSLANQQLVSLIGIAALSPNIAVYSQNTTMNPQLTSFTGSTTFATGSWTARPMQLFVEPGVLYIGTTQVNFPGGFTNTVTAPVSNPRIDLLTIDTSDTLAWTTGTESATPVAPSYPFGKVPICEITNVVGETSILDNANQASAQGFISLDARPFNNVIYINNNNQIAAGVINASNLANAGTCATGSIVMYGGAAGSPPAGWLTCDGSSVLRATYPALFTAIGTTFGSVDGTHFTLPDMRANVPSGYKSGDTNFGTLGQTGGEATHLLSTAEMPAHTHSFAAGGGVGTVALTGNGGSGSTNSSSVGSSAAHNNLQPYLTLNFIIKN